MAVFKMRSSRSGTLGELISGVKEIERRSRRGAKALIEAGRVWVDGRVVQDYEEEVAEGAVIVVNYAEVAESGLVEVGDRILYEDEYVLVIDKPSGLASQATRREEEDHVVAAVERYLRATGQDKNVALHHRLDAQTSGVMILGIDGRANKGLTEAFRERKVKKTYLAVTTEPLPDAHVTVENRLEKRRGGRTAKMKAVAQGGKVARTEFLARESREDWHLIEARPTTGRMHQIRVHLADLGAPIAGDWLYGGAKWLGGEKARLMLHAWKLELAHPVTGEVLRLEAPWGELDGE